MRDLKMPARRKAGIKGAAFAAIIWSTAGLGVLASSGTAHAQVAVIDGASLVRLAQEVSVSSQQLAQQVQQLTAMRQSLASLGVSIAPGLGELALSAQQTMAAFQSLQYSGAALNGQVNSLYPSSFGSSDPATIINLLANAAAQQRAQIQNAMNVESQLSQSRSMYNGQVGYALSGSESAVGPTAAAQATNQILAAISHELGDLENLLIAFMQQQHAQDLARQTADAGAVALTANNPPRAITGKLY